MYTYLILPTFSESHELARTFKRVDDKTTGVLMKKSGENLLDFVVDSRASPFSVAIKIKPLAV